MPPTVVVGKRGQGDGRLHDFSGVASRALWVAGLVYLLGSLLDLGILWIGQNAGNAQFEFVALTRTVEGFPRLFVATALIYGGLYIGGSDALWAYRLLAVWLLVLGLAALAVLALTGLNYASISGSVTEEGRPLFRTTVIKTGGLSLLYVVSLLPLGFLGFSTRKR